MKKRGPHGGTRRRDIEMDLPAHSEVQSCPLAGGALNLVDGFAQDRYTRIGKAILVEALGRVEYRSWNRTRPRPEYGLYF